MPARPPGLNPKQVRFVEEYLKDLNATQAAVRAGYSPATAYAQGWRLLRHAEIAARVKMAQDERSESAGITAAWALERLKIEAEYGGEDSSHSARVAALNLAMKHLGMLTEKIDASVKVTERPRVVEIPVDAPAADREVR